MTTTEVTVHHVDDDNGHICFKYDGLRYRLMFKSDPAELWLCERVTWNWYQQVPITSLPEFPDLPDDIGEDTLVRAYREWRARDAVALRIVAEIKGTAHDYAVALRGIADEIEQGASSGAIDTRSGRQLGRWILEEHRRL